MTVTRVSGESYQWVFYFHNLATGKSLSAAATYSAPSGFTTAQYMIENESDLENFHTISFDDVEVWRRSMIRSQISLIRRSSCTTRITRRSSRAPTSLTNGGHAFSVTQLHCN